MSTQRDAGTGIRTGAQYLDGLRDDRDVWLRGERVADVTTHPTLCRGAHTLARFMDRQFDPAYQNTQFSLDGVADSVDTQNSLHFLYVPEVVELLYIMPDPADADWAGLEGDGSEANPWLVRNVAFNSDGQTMFSFVANTLPDGSGDVVDVNSLTWAAVPSQNVFNNWEPPGTAQFHPNVTDCYVFATNGDGVESNRIYCRAKPFPTL